MKTKTYDEQVEELEKDNDILIKNNDWALALEKLGAFEEGTYKKAIYYIIKKAKQLKEEIEERIKEVENYLNFDDGFSDFSASEDPLLIKKLNELKNLIQRLNKIIGSEE